MDLISNRTGNVSQSLIAIAMTDDFGYGDSFRNSAGGSHAEEIEGERLEKATAAASSIF